MQGSNASSRKLKRDALTPPRCEIPGCEYELFFQRHRIVPGRDGGKYKLGNVIAVCPNHHAEADAGLLPSEYLLEIVQKRIEQSGLTTTPDTPEGTCSPEPSGCSAPAEPTQGSGERPADAADGIEAGVSGE